MKSTHKASKTKPTKNPDGKIFEGTLSISGKGIGYVKNKELSGSIEVDPAFLATALHGDVVKVLLLSQKKDGEHMGEIIEIIHRSKVGFAGVLEMENGMYFLNPSDPRMYTDILIPNQSLNGAKVGQKVFVIIEEWKDQRKSPVGRVVEVLGKSGDHDIEMRAIALEKGFSSNFPVEVDALAQKIKKEENIEAEIKTRKDMRSIPTFTIDPADAKDFDDALSIQTLPNGNIEVGIHIADVSHYVQIDSELDIEAKMRGTSVYLVDRTIPMLPEILSNDLCSLNPNEDKLTYSSIFELDKKARVVKQWFGRTVIHSDKRFSYEEAQEILDNKKGIFYEELNTLNTLAKELSKERFRNGAIVLEQDEVKFVLDEKGVPISVYKKVRGDTNKLIEEFMLLANKKVAEFIGKVKKEDEKIFVYRVHDLPDKDRMLDLATYLKKLGYSITLKNGVIPSKELNALLASLDEKDERDTINTAVIRSMAKAIYSTKNIGHYGLAFEYYTHFTSPIRRYPDVVVHRLLDEYLANKKIAKENWYLYEKISNECSRREKEAADAERASIKYKQVEYMSYHIGEVFDGIISGVTEWGMYAEEKETKCEGMIKLKSLDDDYYQFDKKNMIIVGKKKKRTFKIGDRIRIKVIKSDMVKKVIDYELV